MNKNEPVLNIYLLFTTGSINLAVSLRHVVSKEDICHREPDFNVLLVSVEQNLLSLFQIKKRSRYRDVVIRGAGTAAKEAIMSSVVGDGAILVLSRGEFGEFLHKTSGIRNKSTPLLQEPWGKPFCSSSKAIGSYPGLSCVIGRKKHFRLLKGHTAKTTYLNLATFHAFLKKHSQTFNTPAVPLSFALEQALANILPEGVVFAGYAAYAQTLSAVLVSLALIGIAFYGLRGYTKYTALEIYSARDPEFPATMARLKQRDPVAGLDFGITANLKWLLREQPKILAFDEGVLIFMLLMALIFDQLTLMLSIFAASQFFWGTYKALQLRTNIDANRKQTIGT